jgi:trehalose 6-phosphate synthase
MWNEARLEALAHKSFKDKKLIVVSNREPYIHERCGGRVVCISPAGGLTSALKPVISAAGGTWVAQATGSADRQTASPLGRLRVPPEDPAFTLRRVWIPPNLQSGYYEGLANQALWPLCHNVYQRPVFRDSDWQAYRRVNEIFAQTVLEEARGSEAVVFVQDYHLALLPRMLKLQNPALIVAQFWHIPWPNAEIARTFPWAEELFAGLLGNDLLAFHLDRHCANFIEGARSSLEACADPVHKTIWFEGKPTAVRNAPISIDFERHAAMAGSAKVEEAMHAWRNRLGNVTRVGVGIDRIDYTKGIPERLRALRLLLERNPALRGALTFVQVGVPSRGGISEYAQLERAIDEEASFINDRWGTPEWRPVILEKRNLPAEEMMALHRLSDFCMVTPLHDGMNLVAKEFVASRIDGDGVLILSRFAGAAHELETALQVNPYSDSSICQALSTALAMSEAERRQRMGAARAVVQNNNIYRWAAVLIQELDEIRGTEARPRHLVRLRELAATVA